MEVGHSELRKTFHYMILPRNSPANPAKGRRLAGSATYDGLDQVGICPGQGRSFVALNRYPQHGLNCIAIAEIHTEAGSGTSQDPIHFAIGGREARTGLRMAIYSNSLPG